MKNSPTLILDAIAALKSSINATLNSDLKNSEAAMTDFTASYSEFFLTSRTSITGKEKMQRKFWSINR